MKMLFERSFAKDIKTITDVAIRSAIQSVLHDMSNAHHLSDMQNCKKLHGTPHFYRLRIGDYRIGLEYQSEDNTVILVRCLHRKEIYRYFP